MQDSTPVNQIVLSYPGLAGQQDVRTIKRGDEVLFSLNDVVRVLAAENGRLSGDGAGQGFKGIFKAHLNALESDEQEIISLPEERDYDTPHQTYVTQPGLFRVVLGDTSPAAKNFQRWVLHEVLPSIQKHGTYPPPQELDGSSAIRRATELLLEEIKAREELERKTKALARQTEAKFAEHESRLEDLAGKVSSVGSPDRLDGCVSVAFHCAEGDFDESTLQYLVAMCQKLCLEQSRPHGRRPGDSGPLSSTMLFPPDVIEDGISLIQRG